MFKDFIIRKAMERQMKDVPPEQREMLIQLVSSNPEFFQKVALEIQDEIKAGKNQQQAALEVLQRHRDEFEKIGQQFKQQ